MNIVCDLKNNHSNSEITDSRKDVFNFFGWLLKITLLFCLVTADLNLLSH